MTSKSFKILKYSVCLWIIITLYFGSLDFQLYAMDKISQNYGVNIIATRFFIGYLLHLIYAVPVLLFSWNSIFTRMFKAEKVCYRQSFVLANLILLLITFK